MRNRPILIRSQIASMKAIWPSLQLRGKKSNATRWIGILRPQFRTYKIEVIYLLLYAPVVRVLSPRFIRLPGNEEGELPHVYPPKENPSLCLFDPREDEWNPSMLISETIIPWTLDWLACYELWLMTGKWTGGGRHANPRPNDNTEVVLS